MATFVIGGTTATFGATVRGSSHESGDIEKLTVGVSLLNEAAWTTLLSLVSTKTHVHVPLGGDPLVDVVNGLGEGTLTITGKGSTTAVLISAQQTTWARAARNMGQATFLITAAWTP